MTGLPLEVTVEISLIGAYVIPVVTSLLKREKWSAQVKQAIALVCSLVVAAVALYIVAPHDYGLPLVQLGGILFAASQISYALFRRSAVEAKLASVDVWPKPTATVVK